MKKTPLLALAALLLSACESSSPALSRVTSAPAASSEATSAEAASSAQTSEEAVSVLPSSSVFVAPTAEDFVPRYLNKIASYKTYKAVTKGSTKATVFFIETVQSIDVTLIKSEYSYLKNESHSNMVNTVHEAYFHGEKTAYRNNDEAKYTVATLSEYLDVYGVYPFDAAIEGYLCGEGCIQSVEPIETEQGYAFKLTFDPEKSTNNVRMQMKAFGGLDDYPRFSSIAIDVYVKSDLTPDHLDVTADYVAKMFLESNCHQEYRVDFSSFDETIEVPNLDEVESEYDF